MKAVSAGSIPRAERRGADIPGGQVAFLLLLFGFGSALIFATIPRASLNSVLLLGAVSVGGLVLCRNTQDLLKDPSLKVLGYFWLFKLCMTLVLLYAGWMPQLDQATSQVWGYDPQRYYVQAQELIDNNWSPSFISLKYVGILYYYGAIYRIFGHNPVIPALINSFVTLIASLYVVKAGYEAREKGSSRDWTLAFVLLVPEVLWFDVMTSVESLMLALLVFAMLTTGRYLARTASVSFFKVLVTVGLSVLAIAAVRTSMLLPVILSVALMLLLVKPQSRPQTLQRTILVIAGAAVLMVLPAMAQNLSGWDYGDGSALQVATPEGPDYEWSENSIGLLLWPKNLLQAILFLPPRMVLYLVAPLPYKLLVPVGDLLAGSWDAWQNLFTLLSSVINVLAIPFALASLVHSFNTRKGNAAPLVFHISYWVTFIAIAGGNLIIHQRYRVMASLLLLGCAWLGAMSCPKRLIFVFSLLWYGLLASGALFFVVYKFTLA